MRSVVQDIERIPDYEHYGRVVAVQGLTVEVAGGRDRLSVGARCRVERRQGRPLSCEVVGFRQDRALLLPFGDLDGVGLGCKAVMLPEDAAIYPGRGWLGRVIDPMARPIDGRGALPRGTKPYALKAAPPPAHERSRVGPPEDLGIRSLNTFLTCCRGQRMGIFSGSGIGKSILLSMLARHTAADVIVIGLIGERGREVQEFIEDDLGAEGMARSAIVVATSDEPALMRRQAAHTTMAVAEYFRDRGADVLCLMDSVTRFAMAQREIGLSGGEPPTSKGYTPTVFAELPKLLERAGPGRGKGSITGLFTVLVEGDDHNEPISDAVRGILDGHIVLDRAIAERGRFPAINILRSVSRTLPDCHSRARNDLIARSRALMSAYEDMADMIRLGAYREGSNADVDEAIFHQPALEAFLRQDKDERSTLDDGFLRLAEILGRRPPASGDGPPEAGR